MASIVTAALPRDYPRVARVQSFQALIDTPFAGGVNALCWERTLPGGFDEVMGLLAGDEGILTVEEADLRALPVSAAGRVAVDFVLEDLQRLEALGRAPVLNRIQDYPRDDSAGAVATDVYSFHADSAPIEADTWLCTYHGAPSEGLRNEEALRRVDIPETRAALLREFGGADDAGFREFLREHCYDLHYAPRAQARPFSFGLGTLVRLAVEHPGCGVPPCIHRAPVNRPGQAARLLLIC